MNITALKVLLFVFCISSFMAVAQNPRRTAKISSDARARARKASEVKRDFVPLEKDTDKDGVMDINDKCPDMGERGKVTPFGCPLDMDFDGVFDTEDACVDQPGPRENHGCPWADFDGDGVLDKDDECITLKGSPEFHGCPDSDGDGIPDLLDNCPKEAGVIELRGCPPLKPEEKEAIKKAFDNLLFETGSDVIVESSFASLNDLARVMINNPPTKLNLEGHTDDVGNDDDNMLLSRKRAAAVEKYLEERGIDASRITSEGYGETRPKLPNTNDGNRKVNRRVEMILKYE